MNRATLVCFLHLGLLCSAASAFAQDFSAEVFNVNGKDAVKAGKVYVKGSKMRIDRGDASPEASTPLMVVDLEAHTVTIMDPTSHTYLKSEMDADAGLSFFHISDGSNACTDLSKMAGMQSCKKAGNETINGRQSSKYSGKSEDGKQITMWVDPEVNFIVKWQNGAEVGELRNIKVGAQTASMFDMPSDYHNAVKENMKEGGEKGADDNKEQSSPPPQ